MLKGILAPTLRAADAFSLTAETLRGIGAGAVIFDIDNTLDSYDACEPGARAAELVARLREEGFGVVLLSNGSGARIREYSRLLGVESVAGALKPFCGGFRAAAKRLNLPPEQICVVGDQVFTDVLGGNLAGMKTALTEPFVGVREPRWVSFKRKLEKIAGR